MGGEERKIISIGMEDFKTIIEKNGYFVDKTPMIQQLLDSNSIVTLFTRQTARRLITGIFSRAFLSAGAEKSTCSISRSIRSSACL